MTSIFEPYDLRPNIVYTTRNSSTAAAAMVQDNMGVLLVNELSTRMWRFRVKVLPMEPATVVSRCRSGGAGVDVPNRIDARVFSLISVSARP